MRMMSNVLTGASSAWKFKSRTKTSRLWLLNLSENFSLQPKKHLIWHQEIFFVLSMFAHSSVATDDPFNICVFSSCLYKTKSVSRQQQIFKKEKRNRKNVLCPSRYNKEMAAIAAAKAEEIRKQEEFYANQGYMELSLKSARKIQRIWRGYLVRRIWRKVLKKLKKKRLKEAKKNKKNKKK